MAKKGFLFTIFVITVLTLVIINFQITHRTSLKDVSDIYAMRIQATDSFVSDMLGDLERALRTSFIQSVYVADTYMTETKNGYLTDAPTNLAGIMRNGRVDGITIADDITLENWTKAIQSISKPWGLNLTLTPLNVKIRHISPWIVNISATTNISVADSYGIVGWNFTQVSYTLVDIREQNFSDPIYALESANNHFNNLGTYANITNVFSASPYEVPMWWNDTSKSYPNNINVSNMTAHVLGQYYHAQNDAPDFLGRMEGNFSASTYGIASFVSTSTTNYYDYAIDGSPCTIDYQFLKNDCTLKMHTIINMPSNFVVDASHLLSYQLQKINSS